jgi:hypothetical protein
MTCFEVSGTSSRIAGLDHDRHDTPTEARHPIASNIPQMGKNPLRQNTDCGLAVQPIDLCTI